MTPWSRPDASRGDSVLRDRAFLRLWAGMTGSGLATWALPFLLAFGLTEGDLSAYALGVLLAVRTVGFLVAVPVAGVLGDRHSRRGVVLVAGLIASVASFGLALAWAGPLPVSALAVFVIGAGQGACRPVFQALIAELVYAPQRQRANAIMSVSVRLSIVVAPVSPQPSPWSSTWW